MPVQGCVVQGIMADETEGQYNPTGDSMQNRFQKYPFEGSNGLDL